MSSTTMPDQNVQVQFKREWDEQSKTFTDESSPNYKKKLCKLFKIGDIILVNITSSELVIPTGKVFINPIAKITGKNSSDNIKIRFLNPHKDLVTIKPIMIDPVEVELIITKIELSEIKTDAAILSYIKLNNLVEVIKN